MSPLLPEGISHLGDAPYTLMEAIRHGLRILSYEEWPTEERPPRRIWMDGEGLSEHFKGIERDRKEKYNLRPAASNSDYEGGQENAVELIERG